MAGHTDSWMDGQPENIMPLAMAIVSREALKSDQGREMLPIHDLYDRSTPFVNLYLRENSESVFTFCPMSSFLTEIMVRELFTE